MSAVGGRAEATIGAIAVVVLFSLTPGLPDWARYLFVWLPLLAAVIFDSVRRRRPERQSTKSIQFRFTWMDVLVGAFVGLLLRGVMMAIELFAAGQMTSSASFFEIDHDLIWVATSIVAPAIIAPVVEELFFRGLLLPSIGVNWIGVVCSAIIFSALHLMTDFAPLTALSTFVAGVTFGMLAVRTKRLGASITAHIVYNASLVALSELGALY